MIAGVEEFFNPSTLVGWFGVALTPITIATIAWAFASRGVAQGARDEAESSRRQAEVEISRREKANEWNDRLASHLKVVEQEVVRCEATIVEKDLLVSTLEQRIEAQKAHMDKLLERTPEKLWESVERHSEAAAAQWTAEATAREQIVGTVTKQLDLILARLDTISKEVRAAQRAGKPDQS